jgi:hypothetical protein
MVVAERETAAPAINLNLAVGELFDADRLPAQHLAHPRRTHGDVLAGFGELAFHQLLDVLIGLLKRGTRDRAVVEQPCHRRAQYQQQDDQPQRAGSLRWFRRGGGGACGVG